MKNGWGGGTSEPRGGGGSTQKEDNLPKVRDVSRRKKFKKKSGGD